MCYTRNQLSHGRHFLRMHQLRLQTRSIGDVGHHHDQAGYVRLLVAHGAEVDGKMSDPSIPAQDLEFEIVHLTAGQGGAEGIGQIATSSRCHQIFQRAAQQLLLLVAHVIPAAVGIADQSGSVRHQNQALCVVKNLSGEVALALQFRLEGFQTADIEHQAAVLRNSTLAVAHRKGIDQHINNRSIPPAQCLFMISYDAVFLHLPRKFLDAVQLRNKPGYERRPATDLPG